MMTLVLHQGMRSVLSRSSELERGKVALVFLRYRLGLTFDKCIVVCRMQTFASRMPRSAL
jgi:hypothetical protein